MAWHIDRIGTPAQLQAALNSLQVSGTLEAQQFAFVKKTLLNSMGLTAAEDASSDVGVLFSDPDGTIHVQAHGSASNISSRSNFTLQVVNTAGPVDIIGNPGEGTTRIVTAETDLSAGGLIWGPNPEVADLIDGQGDSFLNHFPGSNYTTLSFGNPATVNNDIDFGASSLMTSLEFRNLVSVAGAILCSEAALLEEFLAPSLQTVGNDINLALDVNLTSLSLPSLVTCGGEFALTDTALETLSLPLLVTVGGNVSWDGTNLSSVLLPSLVTTSGSVDLSNNLSLVTFSAPNWLPETDGSFDFSGCALNAASVEHILRRCMVAGCDNASIEIQGGTNAGYASLSAQGQQDADDLTTAGNSVTLNA